MSSLTPTVDALGNDLATLGQAQGAFIDAANLAALSKNRGDAAGAANRFRTDVADKLGDLRGRESDTQRVLKQAMGVLDEIEQAR